MRPRHLITLAVVLVVVALGVWSFRGTVLDPHPEGVPATAAEPSSPLPESLVGAPLVSSLEGSAAIASVEQLHGKSLGAGLDAAWVGEYAAPDSAAGATRGATLWISRSVDEADAESLLVRMTDRIAEGDSPFTGLVPIDRGGVDGYRLEGLGQVHYYFRVGSDLYWLGIDAVGAEAGLDELLATAG